MQEIIIYIQNGIIQEIKNIPENVVVKIYDFDVNEEEGDEIIDVEGRNAKVYAWDASGYRKDVE